MAEKKSILEEALTDAKIIQEALSTNSKEILRSLVNEEIDSVVKETLDEVDYEEEVIDEPKEDDETPEGDEAVDADEPVEVIDEPIEGTEDAPEDLDSPEVGLEPSMEMGMDDMSDELDMTGASDDEVIAIYKKLSGGDEIEIVGDEIHLNIQEPGEYVVKKGGAPVEEPQAEPEMTDDMDSLEDENPDEPTFEVEMDELDAEPQEDDEDTLEESIPVGGAQAHRVPGKANIGQPRGAGAGSIKESVVNAKLMTEATAKYNQLLAESKKLKNENDEFRTALKKFRTMLVETVVLNSNLSYITKLFIEHATTKEEKKEIIGRFDDEVSNLNESKKLHKTIAAELANKKPLAESVENKLIKEFGTGSTKHLTESTAYVDQSTQRIKDLINRVERK